MLKSLPFRIILVYICALNGQSKTEDIREDSIIEEEFAVCEYDMVNNVELNCSNTDFDYIATTIDEIFEVIYYNFQFNKINYLMCGPSMWAGMR